jgi:hypothetical protein
MSAAGLHIFKRPRPHTQAVESQGDLTKAAARLHEAHVLRAGIAASAQRRCAIKSLIPKRSRR